MTPFNLQAVQAAGLPRATAADFVTDESLSRLSVEDRTALDDYFRQFVPPTGKCPGCDAQLAAQSVVDAFIGRATFTWGIAHGEGYCRACGYPARAYHRDFGPVKFLECVLPVHPDELMPVEEEEHAHRVDG